MNTAPGLAHKYWTRLERLSRSKESGLFVRSIYVYNEEKSLPGKSVVKNKIEQSRIDCFPENLGGYKKVKEAIKNRSVCKITGWRKTRFFSEVVSRHLKKSFNHFFSIHNASTTIVE